MTLPRAMKAFVEHPLCDRSRMNVPAWADNFKCGVEDIRKAWEAAMSEASMKPSNSYEVDGK